MASAKEAKKWAPEAMAWTVSDTTITPFCGKDGDDIDYEAARAFVRHCLGTLKHDGLWILGGCSEYWAMTMDEQKKLAEVYVSEARKVNPKALLQVGACSNCAKDCVELANHAAKIGADCVFIMTPPFEARCYEGVFNFYKYIADHTDIAIELFNSPASGFVLSPRFIAELYYKIPAVCAIKNGLLEASHSLLIHEACPEMVLWECDLLAAGRGGLMERGMVSPVILGNVAFLYDIPGNMAWTEHWQLLKARKYEEAQKQWNESGIATLMYSGPSLYSRDRPTYFSHHASALKYKAQLLGIPVGDYPHSRPPQEHLSEKHKKMCRDAYLKAGFIKEPVLA